MQKKQQKPDKKQNDELSGWYIAKLLGQVGFVISIPLIVFLLFGQYIDRLIGTKIIFTLISLPLALSISVYLIYQKIKQINQ